MSDSTASVAGPPPTASSMLRLAAFMGVAGFGGGVAVIAQIRRRLVDRARALSDGEFLDCLALAQSLPGGVGINLFTQLGFRAGGTATAVLCTVAFVLPSALLMGVLGAIYPTLDQVPRAAGVLASLDASVLAIIVAAAVQIGRHMTRPRDYFIAALVAIAVSFRFVTVLQSVLLVSLAALTFSRFGEQKGSPAAPILLALPATKGLMLLPALTLMFLQIGISLFGGGLAMIPMFDRLLVGQGWITARESRDAIVLSQLTPGPVATACTFVGYRLAGVLGALAATLAVFSPALLLSLIAAHSARRLRDHPTWKAVLAALGPASVGLIVAAAVSFGRGQMHGLEPWCFAAGSLFFLLVFNAPPLLVLFGAGTLRALVSYWSH